MANDEREISGDPLPAPGGADVAEGTLKGRDAGLIIPLPVARRARESFDLEQVLAAADEAGQVLTLRRIAASLVERVPAPAKGNPPSAGELVALTRIHEVLRFLLWDYCGRQQPGALARAIAYSDGQRSPQVAGPVAEAFAEVFPPGDAPARADATLLPRVREVALLAVAATNPAVGALRVLIDDAELAAREEHGALIGDLEAFFAGAPPVEGDELTLLEALRAPALAHPDSLTAQLRYLFDRFGQLLPDWLKRRVLGALDIIAEENAARFGGAGPPRALAFGDGALSEEERFSPDRDWMSNVVLLAKITHVWLDQLSRQYGRAITRLDHIPDEELDRLSRWGFSGLWLIGVWERSEASREIKQRMGNPEALSSAYSLYDYAIAEDLGGEEAWLDLSRRAGERGIRLAADMVPNHFGIDSRWVREHPDRFLQLPYPPFPGYRFEGPNLSKDPNIGLFIEEGYWQHSDAAVVFRRTDWNRGETRFIYHGNDGTQMPWNDTAQLDYLKPDVREAVIQTILDVARHFPIIRFDAAMTLAKRHIRRLWYPAPGEGGAIPSRAEHALSDAEFEARIPVEFWREVVDRVQAELPDTLLLAEAFWLMEGYFVRTLGMHRVYNSAFMNMLKMEENAKYRDTIRNVLAFSPEVLKRFVNFMNNPDERTAVEQFGTGDKYFGVCLMLVTMPGLPMFGHGQIQAFREKYGMEYRRAYWDEQVDEESVRRHEREIFPLMRKRYLFSQADNFALYDFRPDGHGGGVDENVFAWSNRTEGAGGERALLVYHNIWGETAGWIRDSVPVNVGRGDDVRLVARSLCEALGLRGDGGVIYGFRDLSTGREFLRWGDELASRGIFVSLGAYQTHVFTEWRELDAGDPLWRELAVRLNGAGVPSLDRARRELELEPLWGAFTALMAAASQDEEAATTALQGLIAAADLEEEEAEALEATLAPALRAVAGLEALEEAPVDEGVPADAIAPLALYAHLEPALPEGAVGDWLLADPLRAAVGELPGELYEALTSIPEKSRDLVDLAGREPELLGVNEHEGVVWFDRERMLAAITMLELLGLAGELGRMEPEPSEVTAIRARAAASREAVGESGYRLAKLLEALAEPAAPEDQPA